MATISNRMKALLELCLMCFPSDFGSYINSMSPFSDGTLGLLKQESCFLHQTIGLLNRFFLHQVGDIQNCCCGFCPWACPGLCSGTSQPCDVKAFLLSWQPQAYAGLGFLTPSLQPLAHPSPQICKGASTDERLQWHLPEGAAFSWLPNPERTLEGRGSLVQHPGLAHQYPLTLYTGPAFITPRCPC